MSSKWINRYFDLAEHVAQWSRDPSTKVGAVIVGADRRKIAFGFNGFPPGIEDSDYRLEHRGLKHIFTQHAERNALDNAPFDTRGSTLVVTMFPCAECAKSIVSKGIKRVICPPAPDYEPWKTSTCWSQIMFCEAGVELMEINKKGDLQKQQG